LEELAARVGSRFAVVTAAAQRAKQIKDGSPPLVDVRSRNPLTIALAEIAAGKVIILPPETDGSELAVVTADQYYAGREPEPEEPILFRRERRRPVEERAEVDDEELDEEDEEEEEDEEDEDEEE
jgi:DNA-directed RNA polymerase subunit omega